MGMIASSELAIARRWLMPWAQTNPGTRTTPPPTPRRPLTKPAAAPTPRTAPRPLPVGPATIPGRPSEHLAVHHKVRRRPVVDVVGGPHECTRPRGADTFRPDHLDPVEAIRSVAIGEVEGHQVAAPAGVVCGVAIGCGFDQELLDLRRGVGIGVPGVERTDIVIVDDAAEVARGTGVVPVPPLRAGALGGAAVTR